MIKTVTEYKKCQVGTEETSETLTLECQKIIEKYSTSWFQNALAEGREESWITKTVAEYKSCTGETGDVKVIEPSSGTTTVATISNKKDLFFKKISVKNTTAGKGKVYYVSANGSDGNSGTSESKPLKTLYRAVELAQKDSRILLKSGNIFVETRPIKIVQNNIYIGSYGTGSRPKISGKNFTYPQGSDYGRAINTGILTIGEQLSVDLIKKTLSTKVPVGGSGAFIENIEIVQSAGHGINVYANDVTINNILINQTFLTGIQVTVQTWGFKILNSEIVEHNYAHGPSQIWKNQYYGKNPSKYGREAWGKGLAIKGSRFLVKNNYIHDGWGESTGAVCGALNGDFDGNLIGQGRVGIYLENSKGITVKNNLIVFDDSGTADDKFFSGSLPGHGIAINDEPNCAKKALEAGRIPGNKDIVITHNEVYATRTGLYILDEVAKRALKAGQKRPRKLENLTISCNVFSDNDGQMTVLFTDFGTNVNISKNGFYMKDKPRIVSNQIGLSFKDRSSKMIGGFSNVAGDTSFRSGSKNIWEDSLNSFSSNGLSYLHSEYSGCK